MSKVIDIAGKKFNRLTALHKTGSKNYKGSLLWLFKCDCGNFVERESYPVTSGSTKSCGCYVKDIAGTQSLIHGHSNTKEYSAWNMIRRRIFDVTCDLYPDYGGRGLTMDTEFKESMTTFYDYLGPNHQMENDTALEELTMMLDISKETYGGKRITSRPITKA
jgi:hypothetical protein